MIANPTTNRILSWSELSKNGRGAFGQFHMYTITPISSGWHLICYERDEDDEDWIDAWDCSRLPSLDEAKAYAQQFEDGEIDECGVPI